ncbi:MAG: hypothetical protein EXR72_23785 [Myxococcales bacterium]|nr:hypothetical protein [Myxococcales bacterium]
MELNLGEWFHLLLRWFHVFAGILWIGSTWLFTWLDKRLHDPAEQGQVWMVHSGGFYAVQKQLKPDMARTLHWFRWEAALTWISGILLLFWVVYLGGVLVDPDVMPLGQWTAIAIGVGLLIAGWVVYDLLWISPLGKHFAVAAVISYALIVATAYGLSFLFAKRGMYIQVGAMLGTLMSANVWLRIVPAQNQLVAAVRSGGEPDQRLADQAKLRSRHNTFIIMPVLMIMISNHFPITTYGADRAWLVLAVLVLVGWGAAKVVRDRH